MMQCFKIKKYQDTYAASMRPFGLQQGIVGSTAKHNSNGYYYKYQMLKFEEEIAKLQEKVEKDKEGKSTILALFNIGDLAKLRKELEIRKKISVNFNKESPHHRMKRNSRCKNTVII